MAEPVSIVLTGDVMLGRGVNEAIRRFGAAYPWGNVITHLKAADLTIVNLECVYCFSIHCKMELKLKGQVGMNFHKPSKSAPRPEVRWFFIFAALLLAKIVGNDQ